LCECTNTVPDISTDISTDGVPNGNADGVPNGDADGITDSVPNGITNGVPDDVANGVPDVIFSDGVPNGVPNKPADCIANCPPHNATNCQSNILSNARMHARPISEQQGRMRAVRRGNVQQQIQRCFLQPMHQRALRRGRVYIV
jgi:hypothetical protein